MGETSPEDHTAAEAARHKQAKDFEHVWYLAASGTLITFLVLVFGVAYASGPWQGLFTACISSLVAFGGMVCGAALTRSNYYAGRWR